MGTLSIGTPDQCPRAVNEDSSLDRKALCRARRSEERDRGVRQSDEEGHGQTGLRSSGRASERPRNDLDRDPGRGTRSLQGRATERTRRNCRIEERSNTFGYGQAPPAQVFLGRRAGLAIGDSSQRRSESSRSGRDRGRVEIRSGSGNEEFNSR